MHGVPLRGLTLAMDEPIGVIGIVCPDEAPLLGFVSLLGPAIAMGNTVVIVPSERHPLSATDLYQVLETSDLPAGVVNIVTGERDVLAPVLAEHDDVDAIWYFGSAAGAAEVEKQSTGNMKRTWTSHARARLVRRRRPARAPSSCARRRRSRTSGRRAASSHAHAGHCPMRRFAVNPYRVHTLFAPSPEQRARISR